ncbi:MAG TPA: flagellar biosynthetic protein FliR [Terriglobia bacterium]|nr:flagellar biosynthetic protein FliR [Terriglobia bacterium]
MEIRVEQLLSFLFVLTRSSGIFVFTPFFGSLNVPVQVRVLLSVATSYLFALSYAPAPFPAALSMWSLLWGLAGELIVGMAIGFAAYALFAGLQYAGQIAGFQIGLSFINAVDPNTSNRSTTLSVFQMQLGLTLFLALNAHHWLIQAIAASLTAVPPFSMHIGQALVVKLSSLVAQVFVIGFQIAAPVVAVLILTDLALGLIGRSAPQIHILVIGFPLKVLVGVAAMGMGLYLFPAAMRGYVHRLDQDLASIIRLLAR